MSTEHLVTAMKARVSAPDKPVLLALALDAGQQARLNTERLAFLSGYDQATVSEAIDRLFQAGTIYRVDPVVHEDHPSVQFAGIPPEGA